MAGKLPLFEGQPPREKDTLVRWDLLPVLAVVGVSFGIRAEPACRPSRTSGALFAGHASLSPEGGWSALHRADGTTFKNQRDCLLRPDRHAAAEKE